MLKTGRFLAVRLIRSALARQLRPLLPALRLAPDDTSSRRQDLDLMRRGRHAPQRQRGDGGGLSNVRGADNGNLEPGDRKARRFISRKLGSGSYVDSVRDDSHKGGKQH